MTKSGQSFEMRNTTESEKYYGQLKLMSHVPMSPLHEQEVSSLCGGVSVVVICGGGVKCYIIWIVGCGMLWQQNAPHLTPYTLYYVRCLL